MTNAELKEYVRSVLLTFVVTFVPFILATDFEWGWATVGAAAIAAGRTALSAGLPGGSYGRKPGGSDE